MQRNPNRSPVSMIVKTLLTLWVLGVCNVATASRLLIVSESWAPYSFADEHGFHGLDYETANSVFKRLGIDVEWQFLPWKRCLAMIENGQADGILDAYRTPEREASLVFPDEPMSRATLVMYYAKAFPHPFNRVEELQGLTIGTLPGWIYYTGFNNATLFTREPGPSIEANFNKLLLGRIDLVITDPRVGNYVLKQMGTGDRIQQNPLVLGGGDLYLGLRKAPGMADLAQRFADELRRFKSDAGYQQLNELYPGG